MKKEKVENPVHKIKFKKEPIWLKANFVGKYNNIKFRFTYSEYCINDIDNVINHFNFTWPGVIPENKSFAEKGIKELFITLKEANKSTISMKVSKDELIFKEKEDYIENKVITELTNIKNYPENYPKEDENI